MDNFFNRQESDEQQPNRFLVSLQIFDGALNWVAGLVQLTEEEQDEAGVYLGDPNSEYKE